ncbi:MAG: ABC transporter substrate-binding protein [Christensenella sp.]|nr:ABC transporter substrate-binding protein [Christensenella sp.]
MKWVKTTVVAMILAAAMLLAACGTTGTGTATIASSTPTPVVSPGATATASAQPQRGGEIFIAMPAVIESFDPLLAVDEDLINLLSLVYDSPVRLDASGKPQPGLAESWEVDETGTVYTFHLRQNLVFQDGSTPFQVDDVIYSLNRVLALTGKQVAVNDLTVSPEPVPSTVPESGGDGTETTSPEEQPAQASASQSQETASQSPEESASPGASETVELPQSNRYAAYNDLVASVDKVDQYTLRITMTKPGMEALYFMCFPVVSATLYEASDVPVGTGVYKVEGYEPNSQMIMGINEAWWGGSPYIERIVAKAVTGSSAKIDDLETSLLDLITTNVLYAGNYKTAGKTQVVDYMTNYYDCLLPNLGSYKLGDLNVRQAITYAIDRKEIISTVLLNHAVPANMPIASDFYAYDSKYKQDDNMGTAREYLRAAGYRTDEDETGNVLELKLIVPKDRELSYRMEAAKAIKKQLEKIGITVTVEEQDEVTYYGNLQNGNYELAYCSYYLSENPDLSFLFNPGGSGNYNAVNSQEITDAIAACSNAFTEDGIKEAYGNLQKLLIERLPQIGLYYRMNSIICEETIKGITDPRQNMVFGNIEKWYLQGN